MPAIDPDIILMLCSLLGAGAVAGITTGLFGVGGGFIIVPTLLAILPMFAGDSDGLVHTAIGTSLASIIVSSFRAVQTHRKNNLVDFNVLKAWAPWLLIGVAGGVVLASYMDATALIVVFAVGVLVYQSTSSSRNTSNPKKCLGLSPKGWPCWIGKRFRWIFSAPGYRGRHPFVVTMVICGRRVHQRSPPPPGWDLSSRSQGR